MRINIMFYSFLITLILVKLVLFLYYQQNDDLISIYFQLKQRNLI